MAEPAATGPEILETWRRSQRHHAFLAMVVAAFFAVAAVYFVLTGVFEFGIPLLGVALGVFFLSRLWWRRFAPAPGVGFNSKTT